MNTARVRDTREATPATGFPYLDDVLEPPGSVLAMAHRGGARHPDLIGLENTLTAFRHATALGYRYLETDVHASSDGVLFALHDRVLDRVADIPGEVENMTGVQIGRARIGGEPVPLMADLFEEFPETRFNIDIKAPLAVGPLADLLARAGAQDRVCVGAFDQGRIEAFRKATDGRVATAAATTEVARFFTLPLGRVRPQLQRDRIVALQLPRVRGPFPIVTRRVVRRAHAAGLHLHVWTVDEPEHINQMIDIGVDGIFTDRTDVLKDVLCARGLGRDFA